MSMLKYGLCKYKTKLLKRYWQRTCTAWLHWLPTGFTWPWRITIQIQGWKTLLHWD